MAHELDKQIVGLYPRILELEQQLRMSTHARYYYNNLSGRARRDLAQILGVGVGDLPRDYRQYEIVASRQGQDPFNILLNIWGRHRNSSVTSRGHLAQDIVAGVLTAIALGIALLLVFGLRTT